MKGFRNAIPQQNRSHGQFGQRPRIALSAQRQTDEQRERIEWFNAVLYDKQAETVCKYMKKGDCIFVIGKMQSRFYKDRQQVERTVHEIIVGEMQIIHTRQPSAAAAGLPDYL